jgi:hypothetical protein
MLRNTPRGRRRRRRKGKGGVDGRLLILKDTLGGIQGMRAEG